ncbi:hypothetical protein GCM10011575_43630 [Microlunatus endophyticus]|uniref:Uncharacterized protein n=2 Tax=Microlunatus endophyticus TaxID=1716077 RepID=A0A917SIA7_9ACTN|nr:hypothetical protein GCM10011575_43630 [Microlunatus endophyticus]
MHPSLMRWVIRPAPDGRRRLAAAYLTAAAGAGVGLSILATTVFARGYCRAPDGNGILAGLECLSSYFHGIELSILGCTAVVLGLSILTKLGVRYAVTLVAITAPVLLITQLLALTAGVPGPFALLALVAVPAAASWLSARMTHGCPEEQPVVLPRSEPSTEAGGSRTELLHHFGRIFVR